MDEQLLKELQNLQTAYKTGFDLVHQKVQNQADLLGDAVKQLQEQTKLTVELKDLLEAMIDEKDVQISKLMKISAALTVIAEQLTARFNVQE